MHLDGDTPRIEATILSLRAKEPPDRRWRKLGRGEGRKGKGMHPKGRG